MVYSNVKESEPKPHLFEYSNRKLLVYEISRLDGSLFYTVAGFVEDYETHKDPLTGKETRKIGKLITIPKRSKRREDITKFLQERGLEGDVNFW